jgi:AraC family transcriptional regulator
LPPASIPYRRPLLRGREVSLYYDEQRPVVWEEHCHDQVQIGLHFEPALCIFRWRSSKGESIEERLVGQQLCIVAPGQLHSARWENEAELLVLYVEMPLVRRASARKLSGVLIADSASDASHDPVTWQLASTLRHLCCEQERPDLFFVEAVGSALAMRLIKLLGETDASPKRAGARLSRSRLRLVTDYLREHLSHPIHVTDLARRVGLSDAHFSEVFKNTTGLSPYGYLNQTRLIKAHELIVSGEHRMGEVAEATGFYDQSHLAGHFRKLFGYTPKVLQAHTRALAVKPAQKAAKTPAT